MNYDKSQSDRETSNAPEIILAQLFKSDLNIDINPQALRMFIRMRFGRLSPLAHAIHNA